MNHYDWLHAHHVGKWPLDGDLYDDSPNEIHLDGWAGGAPAGYVTGKFGQCAHFSGAAGQSCADLLAAGDMRLRLLTLTLAGWVNMSSAGNRTIMSLVEFFDYSGAWGWIWDVTDGYVLFESAEGSGDGEWISVSSARAINDGQWHWLVVTRDNSTTKLYIDGVIDTSHSSAGLAYVVTYPIAFAVGTKIMYNETYYGERFIGDMQRLQYLDIVLSGSEIYRQYAFQMGWL